MLKTYALYDFQDEGHTGKIHNAQSNENKHLGMFIFDFSVGTQKYVFHTLCLSVKSFVSDVAPGNSLFKVIPGIFHYPEYIDTVDFCTKASLDICGFEPLEVPSGRSGGTKVLERVVDSILAGPLELDFLFNFRSGYLGFLIEPFVTDGSFELSFGHVSGSVHDKPYLTSQEAFQDIGLFESGGGYDLPNYFTIDTVNNLDSSLGKDIARPQVEFKVNDSLAYADYSDGLKLRQTDPSVNYSMQIQHVALSESGRIIELYGFNGYTERDYYPDFGKSFEKVSIKKLNYVTWSGILVEIPYCSMLWYGEIIYFANLKEFNDCCVLYFKEHGDDDCPVCGKPLGMQLSYSFIDITLIPHQFYFCSKDCLGKFNSNMTLYLKRLSKPNTGYLLDNGL